MKKLSALLICLIIISGCTTPGSFETHHNPADPYTVTNEKYVDSSPDSVWDVLVRELSKSFFMINNIDKESRIINVSFGSTDVSEYVDCGKAG